MIHTIQLHCFLTLQQLRYIESAYSMTIEEAINMIQHSHKVVINLKKDIIHNNYIIYLFIDAIKLLKKADIRQTDGVKIQEEIDKIEKKLLLEKEEGFILNRIDYRKDVVIDSEADRLFLFRIYSKLAEKYTHLKKCNRKTKEHQESGDEPYTSTLYFNCKSIQIVVYDKESERDNKEEPTEAYEKDVLRFEIRLCNQHLKYNKYEKDMERNVETYLKEDLYNQYVKKYLRKIFGTGDYYTINRVRTLLKKANISEKEKKALEEFLIQISKRGMESIIGYRENVDRSSINSKKTYSRYHIKKYIKLLEELRINHILIPVNAGGSSHIKNPID